MDPRLLEYYNAELAFLREVGAEFAEEFPKVAARLTMEGVEVSDPYVERLLEGFAFLMARLHLKVDAEFPRFTQQLTEIAFPDYLAPTPSMAMVDLTPKIEDASLIDGPVLPRGSVIKAPLPRGDTPHCQFTTAHDVRLWPIEIRRAAYFRFAPDLPLSAMKFSDAVRGGLRIQLATPAALTFDALACDELIFYLKAPEEASLQLYEAILARSLGAFVQWESRGARSFVQLEEGAVQAHGFEDSESLLPFDARSFQGYRLLREYFSFPQRFLYIKVKGLGRALRRIHGNQCELVLASSSSHERLESLIDQNSLSLFCTPACNVFEHKADRVLLRGDQHEAHLTVDRTRPLDFEVYRISALSGYGDDNDKVVQFHPFYGGHRESWQGDAQAPRAYFTVRRTVRAPSVSARSKGARSGYAGTEVFVSLVDETEAPFPQRLKQLSADVLATNRDLPLLIPIGSLSKLDLPPGVPVKSAQIIAGPTKPTLRLAEGESAWRLLSHLTLNYHSLFDASVEQSSDLLKELLSLYVTTGDSSGRRVIEAIGRLEAKPVVRRLPLAGPITFGRGLAISLTLTESGFAGSGAYLFGAVLERFFARHVTVNSFTQLNLLSDSRGEIAKWRPRTGLKQIG